MNLGSLQSTEIMVSRLLSYGLSKLLHFVFPSWAQDSNLDIKTLSFLRAQNCSFTSKRVRP